MATFIGHLMAGVGFLIGTIQWLQRRNSLTKVGAIVRRNQRRREREYMDWTLPNLLADWDDTAGLVWLDRQSEYRHGGRRDFTSWWDGPQGEAEVSTVLEKGNGHSVD